MTYCPTELVMSADVPNAAVMPSPPTTPLSVPVNAGFGVPNSRVTSLADTDSSAGATSKDRSTSPAGLKLSDPACDARTTTVPAPLMCTVDPLIVAGPDAMLNETGKPDEALAVTPKSDAPYVFGAIVAKSIDWSARATVKVNGAETLATELSSPEYDAVIE